MNINDAVRKLAKELVSDNRYIFSKDVKNVVNARTTDEYVEAMLDLNTKKPIMPIGLSLVYANSMYFLDSIVMTGNVKLPQESVFLRTRKAEAIKIITTYTLALRQMVIKLESLPRIHTLNEDPLEKYTTSVDIERDKLIKLDKKLESIANKMKRVPSPIWKALIKGICDSHDKNNRLNVKKFKTEE